jgi:hypothetical protein
MYWWQIFWIKNGYQPKKVDSGEHAVVVGVMEYSI